MLIWCLQEDMPMPDQIRRTVVRMIKNGFTHKGLKGISSRSRGLNIRIHALAIIRRGDRYDLYPFNRDRAQSFCSAAHNAVDGVHVADYDQHTTGYPTFEPNTQRLDGWLQFLYEAGLIDGYVIKEQHRERPDTLQDMMRPAYIGISKYRLYMVANNTVWSFEEWERNKGTPCLEDAYYEYDDGLYVRLLDIGDLMPNVRKKMRLSVMAWLRRNLSV